VQSQPDLGGTVEGLLEHGFGAPGDVLEQAAMRALQTDQVIAAIGGATDNDPVARQGEHPGGLDEHRSRQRRAVGIDETCRAIAGGEQVRGGIKQTRAEACPARRQQPDRLRHYPRERRRRTRRRIGHESVDRGDSGRRENILGGVPDEGGAQRRRFRRG
jgi:hypothetical protein